MDQVQSYTEISQDTANNEMQAPWGAEGQGFTAGNLTLETIPNWAGEGVSEALLRSGLKHMGLQRLSSSLSCNIYMALVSLVA